MRKKIVVLLIMVLAAVGCNSNNKKENDNKNESKNTVKNSGKVLNKKEYMLEVTKNLKEIENTSGKTLTNPNQAIEKVSKIIDETIALTGPKKNSAKEKILDDLLFETKDILANAENIKKDPSTLNDFAHKITSHASKLSDAMKDYSK